MLYIFTKHNYFPTRAQSRPSSKMARTNLRTVSMLDSSAIKFSIVGPTKRCTLCRPGISVVIIYRWTNQSILSESYLKLSNYEKTSDTRKESILDKKLFYFLIIFIQQIISKLIYLDLFYELYFLFSTYVVPKKEIL